ncbi:NUDIX domain-containing protein [Paenibacillus dokdonensis]|uniref:NUDIX domain-containing protein n=2 Tax=Paenibacillus dokdonensis TaxID=2567944 RepID=A0ABU6GWB3_9BACL|nr:NUDIX domain-containing protein [Paenibacillus dokdonensis]MEC0243644.1 NUDIX domain-containing protein [Paenibacillus dokdonensis]
MMPICINRKGDIFEELINITEDQVDNTDFNPITHAFVVAKSKDGFLLLYNNWKNNWELAGGMIEAGETLRECAIREMLEETNQIPERIEFKGLMKFTLKNGRVEYGGLFSADIELERPFLNNDEATKIIFWDGTEDIGYIDEIDKELLKYY